MINMWKSNWEDEKLKKSIKKPILITGLPGIGNIGKIVVDTITNEIKAKKLMSFFSYLYPNSVMVTPNNLISLPNIELYHKKVKNRDILFLTGDIQPSDESSYSFCEILLKHLKELNTELIITMGGIGLQKPGSDVYITGNDKKAINKFSEKTNLKKNVSDVVGPIYGVTGVLPGVASSFKIPAIILLAETKLNVMHFASKEAFEFLRLFDKKFGFSIKFNTIKKEMKELEKAIENISFVDKKKCDHQDINYIG